MPEPAKDSLVAVRLSPKQKQVVEMAAGIATVCVSDYIRDVLLPAAKDDVAYHAIKNPLGDVA